MIIHQFCFIAKRIKESLEILSSLKEADNLMLAFSGGKDSVVLKRLADMVGLKYEAHFHRTTLDPPEVIKFTKDKYPDVILDPPPISMFALIRKKRFPPTRLHRYCCRIYKEGQGVGKIVLLGIRAQESSKRAKYQVIESCPALAKTRVNPILHWSSDEIWSFIYTEKIPYCSLYDEGFKRLGCVMCPMGYWKTRLKDAQRWPGFYRAFIRCFGKLKEDGRFQDKTTEEIMRWWIQIPEEVELPEI